MNTCDELEKIIINNDITTLFQPIINLDNGKSIGYEVFSRGPKDSSLYSPIDLIRRAEEQNKLYHIENVFKHKALEKAISLENDKLLFLNVTPQIIQDPIFIDAITKNLEKNKIERDRIIFEIKLENGIKNYDNFVNVLKKYIDNGYKIAIDNICSGFSTLNLILDVRPHYIKLDIDLIKNINNDLFKQAIVKSFVYFSSTTNIKIIAEGIETETELQTLIKLGVYAGQGYFLQKPSSTFLEIPDNIKNMILKYNKLFKNMFEYSNDYHYIGNIVDQVKTFDVTTTSKEIKRYFDDNPHLEGICVLKNDYPVGLVMKHNMYSTLANQFGYAVFAKRPISIIMDRSPLIVDFYTPISEVSNLAMARENKKTYDNIIVTKGSKYYGTVSIKKLLQYTMNYEKNYARELNPLTSLPGNAIINRVLKDTITLKQNSYIFYADLDNFKIYNDIYGFENGDKIIRLTADIIVNNVKTMFPLNNFVGHIGGDDFIFLVESNLENCHILCKKIIEDFDSKVLDYFNEKDRNNSYIEAEDRDGNTRIFNLTSVSIVGLCIKNHEFKSPDELAQYLNLLKKEAKKQSTSNYIIV